MRGFFILPALAISLGVSAQRSDTALKQWEFSRDMSDWKSVSVPHDWAIYGPFDRSNDLQKVTVEQNGEKTATWKTGRTGGLPYIGKGYYRTTFEVPDTAGQVFSFEFDGAMSNPRVKVNGKEIGHWAYGYNSFYINVPAGVIVPGKNSIEVSLENKEKSSRWYPGAGLYRNVRLVTTSPVHVPTWGTYVITPVVSAKEASVRLTTEIAGAAKAQKILVKTDIISPDGTVVATNNSVYHAQGQPFVQDFLVEKPQLWSPDTPCLYEARTTLSVDGKDVDVYNTRFGIRSLEYIPEKGFFLNGEYTKFKGVCQHHDLGPLGAAVNKAALARQIEMLKDMGANAIRTSHNMPAPELVELCDQMGMMLMVEPFDDWSFRPKSQNGYGSIFGEWAQKDMENMVKHYRNNASVVMWSVGNEVPSQWGPDGVSELVMLQDICHRLDPTRPVTCGMDQYGAVIDNGFASTLDIPGFNYKPQYYTQAYEILPQKLILGSETASTVSSRGVYMFPMELKAGAKYPNHQSSGYDTEFCSWSNIPDVDFSMDDDYPWMIGQFVWTGFDYLGEPSPYDTDSWPNHSSVFGIIDLASLPKDRYYLYRSQWNKKESTLHILPHWNWKGREGEKTPVMVYTSYPSAELIVNGKSYGIKSKGEAKPLDYGKRLSMSFYDRDKAWDEDRVQDKAGMERYRLVWDDVVYQPGEVRVVAYNADGSKAEEKTVRTAGKAHHLVLTPNRSKLAADGEDLVYITVQVADKDGNIVPDDSRAVKFATKGAGSFRATANGDPTSLRLFHLPEMDLFSGAATAIVQAGKTPGVITFEASAKGVKPAKISFVVE